MKHNVYQQTTVDEYPATFVAYWSSLANKLVYNGCHSYANKWPVFSSKALLFTNI